MKKTDFRPAHRAFTKVKKSPLSVPVSIGGTELATLSLSPDSVNQNDDWIWVEADIMANLTGRHAIYLVFGSDSDAPLCNLDEITFIR